MNKTFLAICYEILSHFLYFTDVADTYKSINDGLNYLKSFPEYECDFWVKKGEIISYIETVRLNNIIDTYQDPSNCFRLVPIPTGKPLSDANRQELYNNLNGEIPRLILKGMHQTIKHLNKELDDNHLIAELIQQDKNVLGKYGLYGFLL